MIEICVTHLRPTLRIVLRRSSAKCTPWAAWRCSSNGAAYADVQRAADAFVTWYTAVHYENGPLRPEYDSSDSSHLNAAGTDVIVPHAVPDVERLFLEIGLRQGDEPPLRRTLS